MTFLTSAFQKNGSRGEQRSPKVKNSENRSNFKSHYKWVNECQNDNFDVRFSKKGHESNKGRLRSKISKIGQISKVIESGLMVYKKTLLLLNY